MHRSNGRAAGMRGFTLLELSVVVLVITLLLGSLLIPLATQVEQRNVSETQKRLQEVKEALIGYAMANGRFPCPAGTVAGEKGIEKFAAGGSAADGNCSNFFDGYVPGITLGLSNIDGDGFVVDAWGLQQNRVRYAISNTTVGGSTNPFTKTGGMQAAGIASLGQPTINLIFVCAASPGTGIQANCNGAQILASDAVFVVYSLGKNAATSGGTSADEAANLNDDPVFVSRVNSQKDVEFDDLMLWSSRYNIISQLTASGQLP